MLTSTNWSTQQYALNQQRTVTAYYSWLTGFMTADGFVKDQEMIDSNGNYTPTTLAHIYTIALGGLCAVSQSDKTTARLIGDKFQTLYSRDFNTGPKGLYGACFTDTGLSDYGSDRYVGNNAFVLMFLNAYQRLYNDNRYKTMADGIAAWIASLQDIASQINHYNDNGIYAGYYGSQGVRTYNATAGNNNTVTIATDLLTQPNHFNGRNIVIISGTGAGQTRVIGSHTTSVFTVTTNWTTNPDATSVFTVDSSNLLIPYKVAEGDADCISALRNHATYYGGSYAVVASSVEAFLLNSSTGLYNSSGNTLYSGKIDGQTPPGSAAYLSPAEYLDIHLWPAMQSTNTANFNSFVGTFGVINNSLLASNITPDLYPTIRMDGYRDDTLHNRIFIEGYAYYALVQYKQYLNAIAAGQSAQQASAYLQARNDNLDTMISMTRNSTQVSGAQGLPLLTNLPSFNYASYGIVSESTCWAILALTNYNPFDFTTGNTTNITDITTNWGKVAPGNTFYANDMTVFNSIITYDDPNTAYDDINTFYDGYDPTASNEP